MANMDLLLMSLSYIEDHLNCEIQTEDIARACFASKSSLEKTFRIQAGFSVHDYILRRRMMKAAHMMIQKPDLSLLDIALSETMKRMLDASIDEDVVFRIGKDEFALITNSSDIKYAEEIQNKILGLNGTTFDFEDKKIPLSLTVAITKINETSFHYGDIFTQMFDAIMDVRKGKN